MVYRLGHNKCCCEEDTSTSGEPCWEERTTPALTDYYLYVGGYGGFGWWRTFGGDFPLPSPEDKRLFHLTWNASEKSFTGSGTLYDGDDYVDELANTWFSSWATVEFEAYQTVVRGEDQSGCRCCSDGCARGVRAYPGATFTTPSGSYTPTVYEGVGPTSWLLCGESLGVSCMRWEQINDIADGFPLPCAGMESVIVPEAGPCYPFLMFALSGAVLYCGSSAFGTIPYSELCGGCYSGSGYVFGAMLSAVPSTTCGTNLPPMLRATPSALQGLACYTFESFDMLWFPTPACWYGTTVFEPSGSETRVRIQLWLYETASGFRAMLRDEDEDNWDAFITTPDVLWHNVDCNDTHNGMERTPSSSACSPLSIVFDSDEFTDPCSGGTGQYRISIAEAPTQ